MALTLRNSFPNDTGTGFCIPDTPAGVQNNDLVLLLVVTANDVVVTPPGEFDLIAEITGTTRTSLFAKVADNEPSNYYVYWDSGTGTAFTCAIDSSTLTYPSIHQIATASSGSASTSKTWAGVTNTDTNTLLLCFGGFGSNASSTPDAAMTERVDAGNPRIYLMSQAIAASGATGTRTATGSSVATQRCITISITESNTYPITYDPGIAVTEEAVLLELTGVGTHVTEQLALVEISSKGLYLTEELVLIEFSAHGIYNTEMMIYLELEPGDLPSKYFIGIGSNLSFDELTELTPQPSSDGVKVTRRSHSHNGNYEDEALYIELKFNILTKTVYDDFLELTGLDSVDVIGVTVTAPSPTYVWTRYNGILVLPEFNRNIRHNNYYPRDIVFIIKDLEEST